MKAPILFSDDELLELHLLLSQEVESSRVELHHTARLPYRDYIKQRMEQQESLLKKVDDARSNEPQPSIPSADTASRERQRRPSISAGEIIGLKPD